MWSQHSVNHHAFNRDILIVIAIFLRFATAWSALRNPSISDSSPTSGHSFRAYFSNILPKVTEPWSLVSIPEDAGGSHRLQQRGSAAGHRASSAASSLVPPGRSSERIGRVSETGWPDLLERARRLTTGPRRILGITGAPGAGKSTIAQRLVRALGPELAVLVGMDGFHLSNAELARQGSADRKGAPHTYDGDGYVALLARLRTSDDPVVYAPEFNRDLEESIGSAVAVPAAVPLVVTEGNYLLVPDGPWARVRPLLDECWYVEPGEDLRLNRLVARHRRHGRTLEEARQRTLGSDQLNAQVIEATRPYADLVISGS